MFSIIAGNRWRRRLDVCLRWKVSPFLAIFEIKRRPRDISSYFLVVKLGVFYETCQHILPFLWRLHQAFFL